MAITTPSSGQGQSAGPTAVQPPPLETPAAPLGAPPPTGRPRWYRRGWVIGLIAPVVGIGLGAASAGSDKTKTSTATSPVRTVVKIVAGGTTTVHSGTKTVKVPGPTVIVTDTQTVTQTVHASASAPAPTGSSGSGDSGNTPSASDLTTSQQNAVAAAKSYLSVSGFSRQGLIDQLSSSAGDGYSVNDATVAVDSLQVDWNAQAVRSAKSYLQMTSFSCQGLIDQLSSSAGEKFTMAQAQYAAHQVGLC